MTRIDQDRIANIAKGYTAGDQLIREARGWLLDCFDHDEDAAEYIESMSVFEVVLAVERYYAGGWEHFAVATGYVEEGFTGGDNDPL